MEPLAEQSPDMTVRALAARIEHLERANRKVKGAGGAALVVIAAALLMGVSVITPRIEEVTGNRFILNDLNNKPRALWTMTATGPEFVLLDPDGATRRALLALDRDGPDLTLSDAAGRARVRLEAAGVSSTIRLLDAGGVTRARLDLRDAGVSLVLNDATTVRQTRLNVLAGEMGLLLDAGGVTRARLDLRDAGVSLVLNDATTDRQTRLNVLAAEMGLTLQRSGGDPAITLLETLGGASQVRNRLTLYSPKNGIAHAYLGVYPDGATHFGLHNAAGLRVFEKP